MGAKEMDIFEAGSAGDIERTYELLNEGVDVDQISYYGHTALINASFNGYLKLVDLLLNKGANVNAADVHGETALLGASANGHTAVVKKLIAAGADISHMNIFGCKAKDLAARKNHVKVMEVLDQHERSLSRKKYSLRAASLTGSQENILRKMSQSNENLNKLLNSMKDQNLASVSNLKSGSPQGSLDSLTSPAPLHQRRHDFDDLFSDVLTSRSISPGSSNVATVDELKQSSEIPRPIQKERRERMSSKSLSPTIGRFKVQNIIPLESNAVSPKPPRKPKLSSVRPSTKRTSKKGEYKSELEKNSNSSDTIAVSPEDHTQDIITNSDLSIVGQENIPPDVSILKYDAYDITNSNIITEPALAHMKEPLPESNIINMASNEELSIKTHLDTGNSPATEPNIEGSSVTTTTSVIDSDSEKQCTGDSKGQSGDIASELESKNKKIEKLGAKLRERPDIQELIQKGILRDHNRVARSIQPAQEKVKRSHLLKFLESKILRSDTSLQDISGKLKRRSSRKPIVKFSNDIQVFETFSKEDYDRHIIPTWILKSSEKLSIAKELNYYKQYEMEVHENSRKYTHYIKTD